MAGLFDEDLDIYSSDSYAGDDYRDTTSDSEGESYISGAKTSTLDTVTSALPDILTIGVNAYGSVAADKLARAYEKDAKEYVGKAEDLTKSNMEYYKNRQAYYDDMLNKATADMSASGDLALQNAIQTERRLNNWTSVFGSTEEALGKYYGSLNEDHIAAFKVNEINDQFAKAKKSLATTYAQRGLASSGAEAEAMLNLEMTSAHTRAKAIYETKAEVAKQQQEFLNTGYAQQANLVNANNSAVSAVNTNSAGALSAMGTMSNTNNMLTNNAMQSGVSLYGDIANMNYKQAGTANQAAYQLAQQASAAASSKKGGGLFGSIGAIADLTGITGGFGAVGGSIIDNITGGIF